MHAFILVACLALQASFAFASPLVERAVDYYDPLVGGGSMLDNVGGGLGEPLNVIISGQSSSAVLTDVGFLNFARSIGFSTECLGIHIGNPQSANLGDGNGYVNQAIELREDYGNPSTGTCLESVIGGNHFRMYRQNGPSANSGALFLAVSKEESAANSHTISPNGYDVGRDLLTTTATAGTTNNNGINYSTKAQSITGLLSAGSNGVNHGIAIDGLVTMLTVTIV